jgi:zinc D-Ala-D-Ala carboxypeptidase
MMETYYLSPHFTLQEMIYSENAARAGVKNTPNIEEFLHLKRLAGVMEMVRFLCGENAVTVTSGFRNAETNKLAGGSSTSSHMSGLACDFIIPGHGSPYDVCKTIQPHIQFLKIDQLIWEYEDWIHLGLVARPNEPRNECLTINNSGTHSGIA